MKLAKYLVLLAFCWCIIPVTGLLAFILWTNATRAQDGKPSPKQKWTYVLLIFKDQPTGKVTEAETFESLEDLKSFVANNAKAAPDCACGEDCTCVDCKCEQRKAAKQASKKVDEEEHRILVRPFRWLEPDAKKAAELPPGSKLGLDMSIEEFRQASLEYELRTGKSTGPWAPAKAKPKLTAVELYLKRQNEIGGATEYGERSNSGGLVGGIKCEKE